MSLQISFLNGREQDMIMFPPITDYHSFRALVLNTLKSTSERVGDFEIKYQDADNDLVVVNTEDDFKIMLETCGKGANIFILPKLTNNSSSLKGFSSIDSLKHHSPSSIASPKYLTDDLFQQQSYHHNKLENSPREQENLLDISPLVKSFPILENSEEAKSMLVNFPETGQPIRGTQDHELTHCILQDTIISHVILRKTQPNHEPRLTWKIKERLRNILRGIRARKQEGLVAATEKQEELGHEVIEPLIQKEQTLQSVMVDEEKVKAVVSNYLEKVLPSMLGDYVSQMSNYQQPSVVNEDQLSKAGDNNVRNLVVHADIRCDRCAKTPIVGIRYKCSECEDYDVCETCEAQFHHEHAFLKIDNPTKARRRDSHEGEESGSGFFSSFWKIFKSSAVEGDYHLSAKTIQIIPEVVTAVTDEVKIHLEVSNSGSRQWPKGLRLSCPLRFKELVTLQIPDLKPGEATIVLISLKQKVPAEVGLFRSVWHLRNNSVTISEDIQIEFYVHLAPTAQNPEKPEGKSSDKIFGEEGMSDLSNLLAARF